MTVFKEISTGKLIHLNKENCTEQYETDEYKQLYDYECDECGEIYLSEDSNLVYCDSENCVDKDIRLNRLHEL